MHWACLHKPLASLFDRRELLSCHRLRAIPHIPAAPSSADDPSLPTFPRTSQSIKPLLFYPLALTIYKDCVLDPFAGSGSTLIAAQLTGRRCLAVELEPEYCDLILARWEGVSGQQAMLAEG